MRKRSRDLASANNSDADARKRLTDYLLSVIENPRANPKRRDEMASHLSKIMASPRPRTARPPTPKGPRKPQVSTYVSKKIEAEAASTTAHKGSKWDGLINGSPRLPRRSPR